MVSDNVRRGSFHRHIMTSGGRTATPARTLQLAKEFVFPPTPTMATVDTQSRAITAAIDTSCMIQVELQR